jgi:hypothetical protein
MSQRQLVNIFGKKRLLRISHKFKSINSNYNNRALLFQELPHHLFMPSTGV